MNQTSNRAAAVSVRSDDVRIVLFGLPKAGKSSLLGALAQAAQVQEHLLNGRLHDVAHGLDALRRRLDEESSPSPAEEGEVYPVDFEWFGDGGRGPKAPRHVGAVFLDCDGRVANDLLMRCQALAKDGSERLLPRKINDADTLVLVVDASAPPAQREAEFAEWERFLDQMEMRRSQHTEVNGWPVFVVLTKCDLLARPGDTVADWMERIEQHKRDLDRRFCGLRARREQGARPLPFGRIDLHLWATAVRRPILAGEPVQAGEPYGVAELFRQCLEQAAAFRRRRRQAERRLVGTVAAAGGIIALMTTLAVGLTLYNLDTPTNVLRERVQLWSNADLPTEAERLHAPLHELRRRAEQLHAIGNDPQFEALSSAQQQWVRARLEELEAYLQYFDRLVQSPQPRDVHNTQALRELQEELKTTLALPKETWKDTEAGRLQSARLQEVEALALAVKRAENWYRDAAAKAEQLRTFSGQQTGRGGVGVNWDRWTIDAEILLHADFRLPQGGPSLLLGAVPLISEAAVQRFEEVRTARADWEANKARLQRVFDLCAALGLATATEDRPAVLVIPRHFALSQVRQRRRELEQHYPSYKRDFIFYVVPEAIRPVVDQAAHVSYKHLLGPAQAAVQKQLEQADDGTEETLARWENVRQWLRDPKELDDWRVLAAALVGLHDPGQERTPVSADPVGALAEFLDRKRFTLTFRRLTLEIPESLGRKPAAEASVLIYHPASAGDKPALTLQQAGEGERDPQRRVWTYSFRLSQPQTLTYRPGDALWATLLLRDDWMFTWVRCRSLMYQFERLMQPPQLHPTKEAAGNGTLEEEVRLRTVPVEGIPRLPDLMPVVRITKD